MSSIKYKGLGLVANASQPDKAAAVGLISVRGATRVCLYTEPADETITGWVATVGWLFDGDNAIDADRVLYDNGGTITVAGKASPGTLEGFQEVEGRFDFFDVPPGAVKAYARVEAVTAGTLNLQMGSR